MIRNRKFLAFWLASLFAGLGSGMTSFGIGISVFEQTDSAFLKSMISLAAFLPTILASPFAGALADRVDRRKLMVLGDALSSLGTLLILYAVRFADHSLVLIGCGVFLSALFSSLIEPAAKATVSDMLPEEDYTKASGLLQLAGAARFLIAPVICALVLSVAGLEAVLAIDLLTIFTTIAAAAYIAKGLEAKNTAQKEPYGQSLRQGFHAVASHKGIRTLVIFMVFLTFMIGSLEELSTPLVLSFTDAKALSMMMTLAAMGLVFSSFYLGAREVKGNKVGVLALSFFLAGLAMVGFGSQEKVFLLTFFGFLFFSTLPFMNTLADYFVRANIPNALQGRVFGIIGTLSQLGYVFAYGLSGFFADYVFRPLLVEGGALAPSVGTLIGVGSGRGIGFMIMCEGLALMVLAVLMFNNKALARLRGGGAPERPSEEF